MLLRERPILEPPAGDAFTADDLQHYGIVLERSRLNEKGMETLEAMMAYDNPFVIERFMADNQIEDREYANACFTALKQYLAVCVLTNGKRTPSKIIDEMWHSFILHMRDYEKYCKVHLRQTVYHDPAQDDSGFKFYNVTRSCVLALFGQADERFWPANHIRFSRCVSSGAPAMQLFDDCLVEV